jgi:putative transposase
MSTKPTTRRVRATYEFIKTHREQYDVRTMCRVLGVAPSGYYKWLQHPVSNRAQEDARLLRLIRASFVASHGIYGAPRVFLDLREAGAFVPCSANSTLYDAFELKGGSR